MKQFSDNYLHILKTGYRGLNLTRVLGRDDFYHRQVEDAYAPFLQHKCLQEKLHHYNGLIDVGFGGGFPLLPLAKYFPEYQFKGIEATLKKVLAVQSIAQSLGISNVELKHGRSENLLWDRPCLLSFKAVGAISKIIEEMTIWAPMEILFYKGPQFEECECEELKKISSWEFTQYAYNIEGADRRLIVHAKWIGEDKSLKTKDAGRRRNLVKLSELL